MFGAVVPVRRRRGVRGSGVFSVPEHAPSAAIIAIVRNHPGNERIHVWLMWAPSDQLGCTRTSHEASAALAPGMEDGRIHVVTTLEHRRTDLPPDWSLADLQRHLGGIPIERIRLYPPPGTATEEDVLEIDDREDRLFELVDGTLVEKALGFYESMLAVVIINKLGDYLKDQQLGKVLGADGALRILPKQVRIPDLCFISWARFPGGKLPRGRIPGLVPDLAVEVLSESNTPLEMNRKLEEYFSAGVRLVWYVDSAKRSAKSYTAPADCTDVEIDGALNGGSVLPGFQLRLRDLFDEADRMPPPERGSGSPAHLGPSWITGTSLSSVEPPPC